MTSFGLLFGAAWFGTIATILWVYRPRQEKASPARFATSESGATATEYGLLLALVSLACFTILADVAGGLSGVFQVLADKFNSIN